MQSSRAKPKAHLSTHDPSPTSPATFTQHTVGRPPSETPNPAHDDYPSATDEEWIRSQLPTSKLRYDLPDPSNRGQWEQLSGRLHAECEQALEDPCGARSIDRLHLGIIKGMQDLGLAQAPSQAAQTQHRRRHPLEKSKTAVQSVKRQARASARRDPAKSAEVFATLQTQRLIDASAIEIERVNQTRANHKLALRNPKKLADTIWGRAMGSDPPECSSTDCATFFKGIFQGSDESQSTPSWLPPQHEPLPIQPLVITSAMVYKALRKKSPQHRSPGIDGITHTLLLNIPWIPSALADAFNKLIDQQTSPEFWRYGTTVLLHKGGPRTLDNYRPITLTPTISKIFHSIVANWLEASLTTNGIIPTGLQKGFLMGISGAIEHDLTLDSALRDAKQHHRSLFMLLVDLKNAFGSVSHARISWAIKRFGLPDWFNRYVENFYTRVHAKLSCRTWSTDYLQLNRGVLQGDTLSPLLFLLVMQVGLNGLLSTCPHYGYTTADGDQTTHFIKCFADDLTIITHKVKDLQLAVDKLEQITKWLGLEIKPSKCRTFALDKGRYRKVDITVYQQTILNIEDAPSKFLGMQLSMSQTFKEKAQIAKTAIQAIIRPLDDFPLPNRDKVEVYKNFALPKMRWVLLVQDLLPTALRKITCEVEAHLKSWWHLPRSTSRDALRLVTGLQSISDIADQSQLTKLSIAQASKDPNVLSAINHSVTSGHKPVSRLFRMLGGSVPANRREATTKLKDQQLTALRQVVGKLLIQGAWSKLETSLATDRQWRSTMWSLPPTIQQFATKAAMDVLPTRANLLRWKVGCDSACQLCGVKETLNHVLNSCSHLLNAGAYTWRHNSILQHLVPFIQSAHPNSSVMIDLPGLTYRLPFDCDTAWRPDIVLLHPGNAIEFIELTCPFEPNSNAAHDRKTAKYATLMKQAKGEGLHPSLHCIEMGSRGIPSPAWDKWVAKLPRPKQLTKQCSEIALQTSHIVWIHRGTVWPNPPLFQIAPTAPILPSTRRCLL